METRHVLLLTFPAQGHINPSLRFALRLLHLGFHVTFTTSLYATRRISTALLPPGLTFFPFSDGYDHGFDHNTDDSKKYMTEMRTQGSAALRQAILDAESSVHPVTHVVYTLLLPWVSQVAREFHLPCALLWIQPAAVLDIYYHYFRGFKDEIDASSGDPTWQVRIPGVPPLSVEDLPSFIVPTASEKMKFALPTFKEQIDVLDAEERPKVLVNTFDALESGALRGIDKYEMIGIGPLIPSEFLDCHDSSVNSFCCDLFEKSKDDYIEWLNGKEKSSVVYVSFGSLLTLAKAQMEEIARGLIDAGRPFLWVIRSTNKNKNKDNGNEEDLDGELSCLDELNKIGKIVQWCSQLEVLTHPSCGCFITHCGWNSTLESISCGVPTVAFPQWTDQGTNAKLIEDVWKTGVRVRADKDGMVRSDEIRRCVEEVMNGGDLSMELQKNAEKWKRLAREAGAENGSSNKNLKTFFEQFGIAR